MWQLFLSAVHIYVIVASAVHFSKFYFHGTASFRYYSYYYNINGQLYTSKEEIYHYFSSTFNICIQIIKACTPRRVFLILIQDHHHAIPLLASSIYVYIVI